MLAMLFTAESQFDGAVRIPPERRPSLTVSMAILSGVDVAWTYSRLTVDLTRSARERLRE